MLAKTGEVVSAASSQESSCLLHSAEMLALEEASLTLKGLDLNFGDDCVVVSTHRARVCSDSTSLVLPVCRKLGIKKSLRVIR